MGLAGCGLHVAQPWDGYGRDDAPAYYFKTDIPPAFSELFRKWEKSDADTIRDEHAEVFLADYQQMLAQVPRQRINFYSDQEMWSIARELSFVTLGARLLVGELQERPDDEALIQAVDKALAIIGDQSLVYFIARLDALEGIAAIGRPTLIEKISAFREIDADLVKAVDAECISFYEINGSYEDSRSCFTSKKSMIPVAASISQSSSPAICVLLKEMNNEDFDEIEYRINLEHIYSHLNRAWNARNHIGDWSDSDFKKYSKYNSDIEN